MDIKKTFIRCASILTLIGAFGAIYKKIQPLQTETADTENGATHQRLNCYYDIMTTWMEHKQNNLLIGDYLLTHSYKKISIYGHGKIGILLYQELQKSGIDVVCFIDGQVSQPFTSIGNCLVTGVSSIQDYEDANAIIVTPSFDFDNISSDLRKNHYKNNIISFSSLLYQM